MTDESPLTQLGMTVRIRGDFESSLPKVIEGLKVEGFGVLTEIDVKKTLKNKLDADFRPYRILGACNPQLAHKALTAAPEVGLVLPCNVTVDQINDDEVEISFLDPERMMGFLDDPRLMEVAQEAKARLARVASSLEH